MHWLRGFGSNRLLAPHVGEAVRGKGWVGLPFAGGMAEVKCIDCRTVLVNDLHGHVINLARVVQQPHLIRVLVGRLRRRLFHPDELNVAQSVCENSLPPAELDAPDLDLAESYFVSQWMGRSGKSGTKDEFNGGLALRWNGSGGDSATRYNNAWRSLAAWHLAFRRCTFTAVDAFDFLERCEDRPDNAVYCDPPFPNAGRPYKHNCGADGHEERLWHERLHATVERFRHTRVVMRFYDHCLIQRLYPPGPWTWRRLDGGKKQTNEQAPEVLILKN